MSFPYRLLATVIHSQDIQIILLRLINIVFFSLGLIAFKRLLTQLAIPQKLINFSLLIFVLIPVVPFLAAHINYDNLLFLLVPVTLSLALRCSQAIRSSSTFPFMSFYWLLISLLLTSLVKYVFLPVVAAIVIYLTILFIRRKNKKQLWHSVWSSIRALSLPLKIACAIGLLVSSGLFIERYGINLVEYHSLTPECSKVESVTHCLNYGPWARNYHLTQDMQTNPTVVNANVVTYFALWVFDLLYRLYFAINYDYSTKIPLPVPFGLAIIITIVGLVSLGVWGWTILRRYPKLLLPILATFLYAISLFYKNYVDYLAYGERVAVNGRYFIPFLPIILVWVGLSLRQLFTQKIAKQRQQTMVIVATVLLLITLYGGGLLTFIVSSDTNWYWHNDMVIAINRTAHNLLSPLVLKLNITLP